MVAMDNNHHQKVKVSRDDGADSYDNEFYRRDKFILRVMSVYGILTDRFLWSFPRVTVSLSLLIYILSVGGFCVTAYASFPLKLDRKSVV